MKLDKRLQFSAGCVGPRTSSRRRREVSYQPAKGPGGAVGKFQSETMRQKRGVQMRERVISQPLLIRQTRQADSEMLHSE